MANWPASLPQTPIEQGYSQVQQDSTIRSAMTYGPDKIRRRTTLIIRKVNLLLFPLSQADTNTLDDFYNTTLGASATFSWIDHRTGLSANYRFLKPPTYRPSADMWTAALELEIIP